MTAEPFTFLLNFLEGDPCRERVLTAKRVWEQSKRAEPDAPINHLTLEGIEAQLQMDFHSILISKPSEASTGTLKQILQSQCAMRPDICEWMRLKTSGSENDCLIHAFLTATIPTFRHLPDPQKNEVAHKFRTALFPTFPLVQTSPQRNVILTRLHSKQFLTDEELSILSQTYGIDILLFEPERRQGSFKTPPSATYLDWNTSKRVYILTNIGNYHFEAVLTDENKTYISKKNVPAIVTDLLPKELGETTRKHCDFTEGDFVNYRGTIYRVIERRFEPKDNSTFECNELVVVDKKGYEQYERASPKEREKGAFQKALSGYQSIPVKNTSIYFDFSGGSRRRTRRSKLRRSFTYKNGKTMERRHPRLR
jgi:hypothetical protein